VSEPEGLSFEPAQWRDYMLDRLSNDGTSSSSSTSLAASEGNATPIMAASPPAPDQPLVSPDSLLDPLEDQPPPSATAACPECAHAQQMSAAVAELDDADELELTVEIKEDDDDQSQEKVFVASMGPAVGEGSYGEKNIDSNDAAVKINSSLLPSAEQSAHQIESSAKAAEPLIEETSDEKNSAPAALSGEGDVAATVPDEEEANSECEYAKEEEPAVGVDSHLMADVVFSQQKLHELLNQLGKESRYSSSPVRTTETDETAAAATADDDKTKIDVAAVEKKEGELLSASKAASPTPPEAGDHQRTPDRDGNDGGGDHEISDHIDRAKLRKCSSLKSGRTPPGTPGVRKIVR
jgi:hypothetical protein